MKYCYHCGKQVSEEMRFCSYCGGELTVKEREEADLIMETQQEAPKEQAIQQKGEKKEKIAKVAIARWQNSSGLSKVLFQKLGVIKFALVMIAVAAIAIILIKTIPDIIKIAKSEILPDEVIEAMLIDKAASGLKAIVIVFAVRYIIAEIPDWLGFAHLGVSNYIMKEGHNARDFIKETTEERLTSKEYVEITTDNDLLFASPEFVFADAAFLASKPEEKSKELFRIVCSMLIRLIGAIMFTLCTVNVLANARECLIKKEYVSIFMSIVTQPTLYIALACWIGNWLFCSVMNKLKKAKKLEWLKKEASDLFIDLRQSEKQ